MRAQAIASSRRSPSAILSTRPGNESFGGRNHTARGAEVETDQRAGDARHVAGALRPATDRTSLQAGRRVADGDAAVTGHADLKPPPSGAVDGGDNRLVAAFHAVQQFLQRGAGRRFAEFADIRAGDEGAASQAMTIAFGAGVLQTLLDMLHEPGAHGLRNGVDRRLSTRTRRTSPFWTDETAGLSDMELSLRWRPARGGARCREARNQSAAASGATPNSKNLRALTRFDAHAIQHAGFSQPPRVMFREVRIMAGRMSGWTTGDRARLRDRMWDGDQVRRALGMDFMWRSTKAPPRCRWSCAGTCWNSHDVPWRHDLHAGRRSLRLCLQLRDVSTVAQNCTVTFLAPGRLGDVLTASARERRSRADRGFTT